MKPKLFFFPFSESKNRLYCNIPIFHCSFQQMSAPVHIRFALINTLHTCTKGLQCLVDFHYYTLHSKCTFDGNNCCLLQRFPLRVVSQKTTALNWFSSIFFFHVLVICILVYLVFRGIDVEVFLPFLSRMWERGVTEIAVDDVCLSVSTFPLS